MDKGQEPSQRIALTSHPWARGAEEVLKELGSDPERGLREKEVHRRRGQVGPNVLEEAKGPSLVRILVNQFKSVVVILLGAAAILAFAFSQVVEGIAVAAVLVINGSIGFFSEWRAVRSMEALRKIGAPKARVLRDGQDRQVLAKDLVPGDMVLLEAGDAVPADMRLVEANSLQVNEASLTGESVAAAKQEGTVAEDAPLAERRCMLYKGTTLTEGSALAVVVATGGTTELGEISKMVGEVTDEMTPLERQLDRLGRHLAWVVLVVAAVIAGVGVLAGQPTLLVVKTAIALGVAAIPEGLPIVANLALARGMWLMSLRNVLIKRLPAVETLGSTTFILSDKTGTITENRMILRRTLTSQGEREIKVDEDSPVELRGLERRMIELGVLCNNASLPDSGQEEKEVQGDPTEVALLKAGDALGLGRQELLQRYPEEREVSFDPEKMMMATFHKADGKYLVAVKGAPHEVLEVSRTVRDDGGCRDMDEEERRRWEERVEALGEKGLRVLAMAEREADSAEEEPYRDLCLVGLVGLLDPPREDVPELIGACRRAGIQVVMVTGDMPRTALAIARHVRIVEGHEAGVIHGRDLVDPEEMSPERREEIRRTRVFARVSPAQKLHLVTIFQEAGEVVAMTGDGVNDTPALKKADIGVAMGQRGTDAAREVSDMVLKDDSFGSIVAAIRQGRAIFRNIRKSVLFMLCTNVAEILAVAAASVVGAPLPLRPLQILYLNMLTDVWPALALGATPETEELMQYPPRPAKQSVLTRHHWMVIGGWGVLIAACVLGAMAAAILGLGMDVDGAVTVSFLTLGLAKLWFPFNLRDKGTRLWDNDIIRNRWIWMSIVGCLALLAAAVYLPGLSGLLQTKDPGLGWAIVVPVSVLPFVVGQIILAIQFKGEKARRQ